MAQEQASSSTTTAAASLSSNQTEIVVAQTPEEQANLDRFDRLISKHGTIEIGHFLKSYISLMCW
jgi:hypothetical protein